MTEIIFSLIILLFSIIIHEIAHGSIALSLGDTTARDSGRLTLNPLKHLDPFGSVFLPLLLVSMNLLTGGHTPIFGWAKPVPINPYRFKDQRWGTLKVALAGPATNFLVAISFGLLIRFLNLPNYGYLFYAFSLITIYNFAWGIFNLIPVPPLDGSHIIFSFFPKKMYSLRLFLEQYGFYILIFLIFFGLGWIFSFAQSFYALITGHALF